MTGCERDRRGRRTTETLKTLSTLTIQHETCALTFELLSGFIFFSASVVQTPPRPPPPSPIASVAG
jgi:hypothetical protein